MAGFDLDLQHSGTLPGGLRIEVGEYTVSDPMMVPTQFVKLLGGMASGEITDSCHGYASSICEGSNIEWIISDTTVGTLNYIAWGY